MVIGRRWREHYLYACAVGILIAGAGASAESASGTGGAASRERAAHLGAVVHRHAACQGEFGIGMVVYGGQLMIQTWTATIPAAMA